MERGDGKSEGLGGDGERGGDADGEMGVMERKMG